MGARAMMAALLLAAVPVVQGADISRQFDVTPGGTLDIDTDVGAIEVTTGSDDRLSVDVELSGPDADRLKVDFEETGQGVRVRGRLKGMGLRDNTYTVRVRYRVSVPSRYDLRLDTTGGSIDVGDLDGEVDADTSGGSIDIGRVTGPVRADTAGGSIEVRASAGDVDADTAGGSIRLGEIGGRIRADTAGGSIRIDSAKGAVRASTAGGGITIRATAAAVDASTAGGGIDVSFVGQPDDDSSIETYGGSVTVALADGLAFDVRASSGTRVRSEFELEDAKVEEDRLVGRLNGGGPRLRLESSGPVRLRRL